VLRLAKLRKKHFVKLRKGKVPREKENVGRSGVAPKDKNNQTLGTESRYRGYQKVREKEKTGKGGK